MLGISFEGRCNRTPFWIANIFTFVMLLIVLFPMIAAFVLIDMNVLADSVTPNNPATNKTSVTLEVPVNKQETANNPTLYSRVEQVSSSEFKKLLNIGDPASDPKADKSKEAPKPDNKPKEEVKPKKSAKEQEKTLAESIYLIKSTIQAALKAQVENQQQPNQFLTILINLSNPVLYTIGIFCGIIELYFMLFSFSYWVKRGHDLNISGWTTYILSIIPIVNLLLFLYYGFIDGKADFNQYDEV